MPKKFKEHKMKNNLLSTKIDKIKKKYNINLIEVLGSSNSTSWIPNCGINSNCHTNSSTCCNNHYK